MYYLIQFINVKHFRAEYYMPIIKSTSSFVIALIAMGTILGGILLSDHLIDVNQNDPIDTGPISETNQTPLSNGNIPPNPIFTIDIGLPHDVSNSDQYVTDGPVPDGTVAVTNLDSASVNSEPIPNTTVTVIDIPLPIDVSIDEPLTNNFVNDDSPINGIVNGDPEPDLSYNEVPPVTITYSP